MAIPEFHFDFDAALGKPYDQAFNILFKQLEAHYNQYIQPPPLIFGAADPTVVLPDGSKAIVIPKVEQEQEVVPDFETITPKTIPLRSFKIVADKGVAKLEGVSMDGKAITDTLKKGYDVAPYGQVVSGHNGRYNLKP